MIKKNVYSVKSISVDSVIAFVLAGVAVLCLVLSIIISYRYEGNGPRVVGLLGAGSFLASFMGVVFAKSAWNSPDGGVIPKRIALLLNLIILAGSMVFYLLGCI